MAKSNPAIMKTFIDLTGQKFGRLTVINYHGKSKENIFLFLCECECGNIKIARGSHLKSGEIKSCGCYRRECSAKHEPITHGHCTHGISPTYKTWSAMWTRCTDKKHPAYNRYGGREISVCDRWKSFECFLADMGERPEGKTIDRIDGNGNYTPENCRWATPKQQSRNTCKSVYISFNGESLICPEWSRKIGIKQSTLRERLVRGWSVEKTLTTPV